MLTLEQLASLTPNMRVALRECNGSWIGPRDTYWITLQGLAGRNLVDRPTARTGNYHLTKLGVQYCEALKTGE